MLGLRQLRQWSVERLEHVRIDGVSGLADTPALAIDAIAVVLYQTPSATTLFDNVPNDTGRERSSYCRWFTGPKKRVRRLRAHCGSVRGHSYSATDDDTLCRSSAVRALRKYLWVLIFHAIWRGLEQGGIPLSHKMLSDLCPRLVSILQRGRTPASARGACERRWLRPFRQIR